MENVSVVIVTHRRALLLERLLNSLMNQDDNLEIVIILNDNNPEQNEYRKLIQSSSYKSIRWINRKFKTPGLARNEGVKHTTREWILFLDDDVDLPEDFLKKGYQYLKEINNEHFIMGGPDQDFPQSTAAEQALSLTLMSPMATAHTRFRHKTDPDLLSRGDETNLILCNLWVHRSVFEKYDIKFRESFFRNEENVFITEGQNKGLSALYNPKLAVFHRRKTRLDQLGKALISSGKHRVKSFLLGFKLKSLVFFIPAIWVLYLFGLPIFSKIPYGLFPLQLYIALTIFINLKITSKQPQLLPLVIIYQVFINFFYGVGVLLGLTSLVFWSFRKSNL